MSSDIKYFNETKIPPSTLEVVLSRRCEMNQLVDIPEWSEIKEERFKSTTDMVYIFTDLRDPDKGHLNLITYFPNTAL